MNMMFSELLQQLVALNYVLKVSGTIGISLMNIINLLSY